MQKHKLGLQTSNKIMHFYIPTLLSQKLDFPRNSFF